MNRKEITETIAKVGAGTFAFNGSMSLINPKTGEGFDVDMGAPLAIVRGTLAWVDTLLEDDAKPEQSLSLIHISVRSPEPWTRA